MLTCSMNNTSKEPRSQPPPSLPVLFFSLRCTGCKLIHMVYFPGLPTTQFLIACSMLKKKKNTWVVRKPRNEANKCMSTYKNFSLVTRLSPLRRGRAWE